MRVTRNRKYKINAFVKIAGTSREYFFKASELHLKLEIRCTRTDCVSRRIIITIIGLIIREVVSLQIAEFRCKVLKRAIANSHEPADIFRIHRMWIMQRGNTYECECRYVRPSLVSLFGSAHFGTNIRVRRGKQGQFKIDGRKRAIKHRARDWSYLSCRSSGSNGRN